MNRHYGRPSAAEEWAKHLSTLRDTSGKVNLLRALELALGTDGVVAVGLLPINPDDDFSLGVTLTNTEGRVTITYPSGRTSELELFPIGEQALAWLASFTDTPEWDMHAPPD